MSIRNFSDHAANERTFLAWVRTAIAVTAFGFLVERFDLFLAVMAPSSAAGKSMIHRSAFGREAGLILIAAGVAITTLAALRFVRTAREIDDTKLYPVRARASTLHWPLFSRFWAWHCSSISAMPSKRGSEYSALRR